MNKNDIIGIFRYAKVVNVESDERVVVEDLETGRHFAVVGHEMVRDAFNATSPKGTQKVTRTQVEAILQEAGHQPFTVTFTKSDGSERVLAGIRVGDGHFGRSKVVDLELQAVRQVDHRTISRLVINSIEYLVK